MKDLIHEIKDEGKKLLVGFDMVKLDDIMDDFDIDNYDSSEFEDSLSYFEMNLLDKHYVKDTKDRRCTHSHCKYIRRS